MATTMKLIAKNVLGSDTSSVTFSGIPDTFDDLVLEISARSTRTSANRDAMYVYPNSSTSNLSTINIVTDSGTNIGSGTSTGNWYPGQVPTAITSAFGSCQLHICNYSAVTSKMATGTSIHEDNAADSRTSLTALLWSDATAISSLFIELNIGNFAAGSSFYLYGITKA